MGIAHDNLEKARNDLIQKLRGYSKIKGHHITLVFDGWKNGQKNETEIKTANLTVIFSRLGEKADYVMKKIISASSKPLIVVSSDREVSEFAAKKEFAAVSSNEFEEKLYSAFSSVQEYSTSDDQPVEEEFLKYSEDEIDPDNSPEHQKGNPRKLSKKQKKKLQALKKL